jgi:hypothetical protein
MLIAKFSQTSVITLTDTELLSQAATDIQMNFAFSGVDVFKPAWVFVATWKNASFTGADPVSYLLSLPVLLLTVYRTHKNYLK